MTCLNTETLFNVYLFIYFLTFLQEKLPAKLILHFQYILTHWVYWNACEVFFPIITIRHITDPISNIIFTFIKTVFHVKCGGKYSFTVLNIPACSHRHTFVVVE